MSAFLSSRAVHQGDSGIPVGRRGAPRLRLSLPGRLMTLRDRRRCIVVDLSRSGVQIALEEPLDEGDGAVLNVASLELFGVVVRRNDTRNGGANGLEFDCPLSDDQVLEVRRFSEGFAENERRALLDEARAWVTGQK